LLDADQGNPLLEGLVLERNQFGDEHEYLVSKNRHRQRT
jgi:hypothetical protein